MSYLILNTEKFPLKKVLPITFRIPSIYNLAKKKLKKKFRKKIPNWRYFCFFEERNNFLRHEGIA